jgi:PAS domain S-box-containing protein
VYFFEVKKDARLMSFLEEIMDKGNSQMVRLIFDADPDPCWLVKNGMIVECNAAAVAILGLQSREEVVGRSLMAFSSIQQGNVDDIAGTLASYYERAAAEGMVCFEWSLICWNRAPFVGEMHLAMIGVPEEKLYYCKARDITEQKRAAMEAKANEQRYRTLIAAIPQTCVLLFDHEYRFLFACGEELEKSGLRREQIEGRTLAEVYPLDAAEFLTPFFDHALSGGSVSFEHQIGSMFYHQEILPIQSPLGTISAGMMISYNITERKKLELQRQEFEKQEFRRERLESLGFLAGGVAHDFNNILAAIRGYVELAAEDLSDKEPDMASVNGYLSNIHNSVERAINIVKQILIFSRQEDSSTAVPLDICSAVDEAIRLMRVSLPSTVRFEVNLDNQCGIVLATPFHIHQIIVNICTNSFQALQSASGRIEITLERCRFMEQAQGSCSGESARLRIVDNGCGMSPEVLDRIFDPFFTTKKQGEGTGLGLSAVYGIVEKLGGKITVQSTPGAGTTMDIYLPLVAKSACPEASRL